MKKSAVFMNIGRGPTVNEDELAQALQEGQIAGAVLDVYTTEPLSEESPFWGLKNVLMYPHCADDDVEYMDRTFAMIREQLTKFRDGLPLDNITDKRLGY